MITAPMFIVPLLLVAVWTDARARRIPNALVLTGLLLGLGFSTTTGGIHGTADSALGVLTGFAILFPFYLVRLVGAGDVKLLAMIGSFVHPVDTALVAGFSFAAGGLFALMVLLHPRRGPVALANIRMFFMGAMARGGLGSAARDLGENTAARIPYALAIAAGYGLYLLEGALR